MYAPCGWHSLSLWRSLREKVLLPSRGVPAFTASWYPRSGVVSIEEAALGLPSRGLVVLAQRNRKERSLMQSDQIFKLLGQVFPTHKVVVFEGDMGILEGKIQDCMYSALPSSSCQHRRGSHGWASLCRAQESTTFTAFS